jgi:hypothetical protein
MNTWLYKDQRVLLHRTVCHQPGSFHLNTVKESSQKAQVRVWTLWTSLALLIKQITVLSDSANSMSLPASENSSPVPYSSTRFSLSFPLQNTPCWRGKSPSWTLQPAPPPHISTKQGNHLPHPVILEMFSTLTSLSRQWLSFTTWFSYTVQGLLQRNMVHFPNCGPLSLYRFPNSLWWYE